MRHLLVAPALYTFALAFSIFGRSSVADDSPRAERSSLPLSTNSIGMKFVTLPAGSFVMGLPPETTGVKVVEKPAHQVELTEPFQMGVYEVTQEQYQQVMKSNPSKFQHPHRPVENVSWRNAVKFCETLSSLPGEVKSGYGYHLPSEMEWEYACRAGTSTHFSSGDDPAGLKDFAWVKENSGGQTHPVGLKKPNAWGLYDMHGNVLEWCRGRTFRYNKYASGRIIMNWKLEPWSYKPTGRVIYRSGSWSMEAKRCYSAYRMMSGAGDSAPNMKHLQGSVGFRVIRMPCGT